MEQDTVTETKEQASSANAPIQRINNIQTVAKSFTHLIHHISTNMHYHQPGFSRGGTLGMHASK